jgi:xylan 1,4-beta-xylosidase
VSTMVVSVKNNFERRIGIWPTGFDKDDVMYTNTAFGDYPHYLPTKADNHLKSKFTGWMLLNYNKPVQVSSTLGGYQANYAVDESIRTYWSAASGKSGEWIQTDLGAVGTVHAVQLNYADQDAEFLGKQQGTYHQYQLLYSLDGKKWQMLVDKSKNKTDVPHDYVALEKPIKARYIKMINLHMPTGKFAISGLRVFGKMEIARPAAVKDFLVLRTEKDKRSAWIRWTTNDDAYAYNIYIGTDPDKLYNCIMIYGANEYWYKGMDKEKPYYFRIEALNENGQSKLSDLIKAE